MRGSSINYFYFTVLATALYILLVYHKDLLLTVTVFNEPKVEKIKYEIEKEHSTKKEDPFGYSRTLGEKAKPYIEKERLSVQRMIQNFTLHKNLGSRKLEEFIPEKGGSPLITLVITQWRSGSTFIGDIIQSHPMMFYHYEPLAALSQLRVIRGGATAKEAVRYLKNLFKCDYRKMEKYTEFYGRIEVLRSGNNVMNKICSKNRKLCKDPSFLGSFCSLYPYQNIKVVRLNLKIVEELIKDDSYNLRVILMVRDPRGTRHSRSSIGWCHRLPDCEDPARSCRDLVEDYKAARKMSRKYPDKFRILRYEDLSSDVYNVSARMFDFLRLTYGSSTKQFLASHTNQSERAWHSTFRNSKSTAFHWQREMSWRDVHLVQTACKQAMELWGYVPATNNTLRTMNPMKRLNFTNFDIGDTSSKPDSLADVPIWEQLSGYFLGAGRRRD